MWIHLSRLKLHFTPGFFILLLNLCFVPPWMLLQLLAAALLHEAAHCLFLTVYKVPIQSFHLTAFGLEITAPLLHLSYPQELLTLAAGPAVNFFCSLISAALQHYFFAGISLMLCLFNLLPIVPLDGGRILECLLCWLWDPVKGDRLCRYISGSCAMLFFLFTGIVVWRSHGNLFFLLFAAGLCSMQFPLVKHKRKR